MKNQLLEDMDKEPSAAPVIEVLYEYDGGLISEWSPVVENQGILTKSGIIDLADVIVYNVRIKNESY